MKNIFHKSCKKAMKVENMYKHSGGVGELVGLPYFGYTYRAGGDVAAMTISWWGEVRTQRQASRTTPYLYALIHFYSFLNLSSSLSLIYVFSLYSCHSGDGNISSNWSQNVNIVPRHTQPSTCSRTSYLSCFIPIYTYPAPHTFATSPTEYRDTYNTKESISAEPQEQVLLGKQDSLPPVQMLRWCWDDERDSGEDEAREASSLFESASTWTFTFYVIDV